MSARTRRTLAAGALAVSAMLTVVPITPTSAATARIHITGAVSDSFGYPLAGMIVQVVRADHEDSDFAEARTYERGVFATPKVPVDASMKYVLEVTDPTGRHQTAYSKAFSATAANRVQNVALKDAAVIRGKVKTKIGNVVRPADRILVEAFGTAPSGKPIGGGTFTSSRGAFFLGGLPSGRYTLVFTDYDEDGSKPGPRFNTTCFDNVPVTAVEPDRCEGSKLVKVTVGDVRTIRTQVLDDPIEP